jgi:hypothetical protein
MFKLKGANWDIDHYEDTLLGIALARAGSSSSQHEYRNMRAVFHKSVYEHTYLPESETLL